MIDPPTSHSTRLLASAFGYEFAKIGCGVDGPFQEVEHGEPQPPQVSLMPGKTRNVAVPTARPMPELEDVQGSRNDSRETTSFIG